MSPLCFHMFIHTHVGSMTALAGIYDVYYIVQLKQYCVNDIIVVVRKESNWDCQKTHRRQNILEAHL